MKRIALVTAVLFVAGCAHTDPYQRTDVWYPTGSNAGNLAAMVVRPADLIQGRGETTGDSRQSVIAIDHVWQGQSKPLVSPSATSAGGAAAPATGSGGPN
ncbi:MAG: hypothetical protein QOH05_731 [Acetobacteraceae bacterium]|jgi:type IV pilus biogenesis protein CpaD/CtpE|nr:hypothetical protein [Acetobacteraceae bacterium]